MRMSKIFTRPMWNKCRLQLERGVPLSLAAQRRIHAELGRYMALVPPLREDLADAWEFIRKQGMWPDFRPDMEDEDRYGGPEDDSVPSADSVARFNRGGDL